MEVKSELWLWEVYYVLRRPPRLLGVVFCSLWIFKCSSTLAGSFVLDVTPYGQELEKNKWRESQSVFILLGSAFRFRGRREWMLTAVSGGRHARWRNTRIRPFKLKQPDDLNLASRNRPTFSNRKVYIWGEERLKCFFNHLSLGL